jgi:hypothetical protein
MKRMSLPATRPRRYQKSGLYCRPTRLGDLPVEVAEARRARADALVADLGGIEQCSNGQLQLVDLIVSAAMQLESVDAYLLSLPSLVDKRNRRCWQVVRDRQALSGHVQSLLATLGLRRRSKKVQALADFIADHDAGNGATAS